MKKIIKIFSLLMFIIFVFGITTSCNAWEEWEDKHKGITPLKVEATHTGNEMIEAVLNEGHYLTGISWNFLKAHEAIYCRNRYLSISASARYLADGEKIEYPKDDTENGYARAYILANNLYTEEDGLTINEIKQIKQTTWHLLNGQGQSKDDRTLLNIAKAYNEYKKQFTEENPEKTSVLWGEETGAQLTTIGEDLAYGPIKIGYSYAGITENGITDEWGGFYYTFINELQEDISEKVILCTKTEEGNLEPIISTKKIITIDENEFDYYKVSTSDYSNVDLYLKISTDISKLSMKIFENKVDYSASVLELEGTNYAKNAWTCLCQNCDEKYDGAKIINLDNRGMIDWEDFLSNEVLKADVDFDNDGKMTVNNFKTIIIYQGKEYMYLGTSLAKTDVHKGIDQGEIVFSNRFGNVTKNISGEFDCDCDPTDGNASSSCKICEGKDKEHKYLGTYKLTCGSEKKYYYNYNVSSCYSDITSAPDIDDDDEAYFLCKSCGYKSWYDSTSQSSMGAGETNMLRHIEANSEYSSKSFVQYRKVLFNFRQIGCDTEIKYSLKDETATRRCGIHSDPDIYYGSQELTIVDTAKIDYSNSAEFEIEIPLMPSVQIEFEKYNSHNAEENSELENAEFTVEAIQDGKTIYSEVATTNEVLNIVPSSYNPVYIKITETKAPNGYTNIKEQINCIMYISNDRKEWKPTIIPSEDLWKESGIDTFGKWEVLDDGDRGLPNTYKSESEDYIYVHRKENTNIFKFNVYNEPKINKIKLIKIDDSDETKFLQGAKFNAIISNVESLIVNGKENKINENNNIVQLTTNDNGECVIEDLKLIDENSAVEIKIEEFEVPNSNSNEYYYKKLSAPVIITLTHTTNGLDVKYSYSGTEIVTVSTIENDIYSISVLISNKKAIRIGGYVWEDKEKGTKPVQAPNGIMDDENSGLEGISVFLYRVQNDEVIPVAGTATDATGHYVFEDCETGDYYVKFEYDGINYEDTIHVENGSSKAFEKDEERNTFNGRFKTITYKQSNDGTTLNYKYENNKSSLITTEENGQVKQEFVMHALTETQIITESVDDLNLGLVKRGTDIALSTDVANAQVTINGEQTDYIYNKDSNTIKIVDTQTSETVSYNLNLYSSDYNYRIRNYVSDDSFAGKNYINSENPNGVLTGDELKVFVVYELNLQNQSTKDVRINKVKYTYDEKYTLNAELTDKYNSEHGGITHSQEHSVSGENVFIINLDGLLLKEGETQTRYFVFEVNNNQGLELGNFSNKAEITSYSTDEGLIDIDSQPDNFITNNQPEDDSDTAGGLVIEKLQEIERTITGKVFANNNENVNGVIVQLIELKTVNGKVYEYIWQETVSGTGKGLRLNAEGTDTEQYSYDIVKGEYEFSGFIPGNYIVRFIYGDGTAYMMTSDVLKYNGQDYKSVSDANYNKEWYDSESYTQGASVARDNEARRLETMAYSVEIDAEKGILLKLLDNYTVDDLNETEKETLVSVYNKLYDLNITTLEQEHIDRLLEEQVLPNTWMCAETSKIIVTVDNSSEAISNIQITENIAGKASYDNINLGLELRPQSKIELKKYITGFKLTAADGQTLVNAYVDVNEYLNNTMDANKVQGIKDNVTILDTLWQYEVSPVDINTVVDGAKLEFQYTLVVKNIGDTDYLSTELANAYNGDISAYKNTLTTKADDIKEYMRNGTYIAQIGKTLGNSYYVGGTGEAKVLTEVTNIRDYINNDLSYTASGENVTIDETASKVHRILRDDYSMQQATINTILKTTKATGKMNNDGNVVLYTVTLGKNPVSSTGNLNFDTYIAEVMSYTNAAGRRSMEMTPGNAEIIQAYPNKTVGTHECDEADTGRIQLGVATGEDEKTNYIIIISVIAGIALLATGAFVVKKYVIK